MTSNEITSALIQIESQARNDHQRTVGTINGQSVEAFGFRGTKSNGLAGAWQTSWKLNGKRLSYAKLVAALVAA